jgi:hypothetical protein
VWMITPQLTEQYGQVDRVSVVREIFSARDSAYAGVTSNPRRVAPAAPTQRKSLRVVDIQGPPYDFNALNTRIGALVKQK